MRSRTTSSVFASVLLFTCALLAQEPSLTRTPPEPRVLRSLRYADVKEGDRVRLVRTVGTPFSGTTLLKTERFLRLDLTHEPGGLPAQVDFPVRTIRSIDLLEPLTTEERREVETKLEQARVQAMETVRQRYTTMMEESGVPPMMDRELAPPLLSERQMWLLTVFPPDTWGPERLAWMRQRWIVIGLPPGPMEGDFYRLYPEWLQAAQRLQQLQQWGLENRGVNENRNDVSPPSTPRAPRETTPDKADNESEFTGNQ